MDGGVGMGQTGSRKGERQGAEGAERGRVRGWSGQGGRSGRGRQGCRGFQEMIGMLGGGWVRRWRLESRRIGRIRWIGRILGGGDLRGSARRWRWLQTGLGGRRLRYRSRRGGGRGEVKGEVKGEEGAADGDGIGEGAGDEVDADFGGEGFGDVVAGFEAVVIGVGGAEFGVRPGGMDRGELAGEVGGGEVEVAGEADDRAQEDGFEGVDAVGDGGEVGVGHGKKRIRNTNFEVRNKFEMLI